MSFFQHIETRNELADFLGIPRKKLTHLLYVQRIENCYHMFEVPKRAGGTRVICAPTGDLKSLQRSLARRLQEHCLRCREERGLSVNIAHAFSRAGASSPMPISIETNGMYSIPTWRIFSAVFISAVSGGIFRKTNTFKCLQKWQPFWRSCAAIRGNSPRGRLRRRFFPI